MTPTLVISILIAYFVLLIVISKLTSKKAQPDTFFTANKQSPWYLVAFGMIGASLSGVTFISVPGEVLNSGWSYFGFVMGNIIGYWLIAFVLLPIYYKSNLVSIYTYLRKRFGVEAHKAGAFFFILSKTVGAAFRMFLVASVLQLAFFDAIGCPFWLTVTISIFLIWTYTFKGGIKTIVWTDTLQTLFLLLAVIFTIISIKSQMNLSFADLTSKVYHHPCSKIFYWNPNLDYYFWKQFISGIFVTIVMVGLDQDMMQKNLTCKSLKESQKNMLWFSFYFPISVLFFLILGVLLKLYSEQIGIMIPESSDDLYPIIALGHLNIVCGVFFLLGITAAAYSSADSALTALTTSFCIDFLQFDPKENDPKRHKLRRWIHLMFSIILILVVILFKEISNDSVVKAVFKAAGYTYGPILGLFAFAIFTKKKIIPSWIIPICIMSPLFCYWLSVNSESLFYGYRFGFEIIIINGLISFIGFWLASSGHIYSHKEESH